MPIVLPVLLACLMLTTTLDAQDEPPDTRIAARNALLFQIGMESLAETARSADETERRGLHDKAIAAFRMILINRPDLVRVRLELARTFFLLGRDGLARRRFELVLAGGVPPPVALNIYNLLNVMRDRKRWTGYFGAPIAPGSNLNAASESEIIYFDTVFGRLPFQREGDFGAQSGLGISVRVGSEAVARIRRPRLRPVVPGRSCGAALAGRAAHRVQPAGDGEPPVARRSSVRRRDRRAPRNGPAVVAEAVGARYGGAPRAHAPASRLPRRPGSRFHLERGVDRGTGAARPYDLGLRAQPRRLGARTNSRWLRLGTSLALPLGFTVGVSSQMRWIYYYASSGQVHLTIDGRRRRDCTRTFSVSVLNRALTLFGFSPQLALIHDVRLTNAHARDCDRDRAEVRFVRQF